MSPPEPERETSSPAVSPTERNRCEPEPESGPSDRVGYYEAWTSKDLEQAMTFISEDIVCDAPAGRIEGAEAYRAFMGPFVQILIEARMIAASVTTRPR